MKSYKHFYIVSCPYCNAPPKVGCHWIDRYGNKKSLLPHEGRKKLARKDPKFEEVQASPQG